MKKDALPGVCNWRAIAFRNRRRATVRSSFCSLDIHITTTYPLARPMFTPAYSLYKYLRARPTFWRLCCGYPHNPVPHPLVGGLVRSTCQGRPGSYTIDDISVGGTIDVYGRRFHVVDANGATRRLLEERWGRFEAPAIPFPVDRYTVERKEFMSRQTGCDPNVQHKIIKVDGYQSECETLPLPTDKNVVCIVRQGRIRCRVRCVPSIGYWNFLPPKFTLKSPAFSFFPAILRLPPTNTNRTT